MEIRNRMPDVIKLRTNACQDLLKMIIQPGWQQSLYNNAEQVVNGNSNSLRNTYIHAYHKMRDTQNGISSYSVEDMDVTLICTIVTYWNSSSNYDANYAPLCRDSIQALRVLRENRNVTNHSSENEDADELYLRALLSLVNLRRFINVIDEKETKIPDHKRLAYRQEYIEKIKNLMSLIDDERIELVQRFKEFDRHIELIKQSENPKETWGKISGYYDQRVEANVFNNNDLKEYNMFFTRASDAGIVYAHHYAALLEFSTERSPNKGLRRLRMILDAYAELPKDEVSFIVSCINKVLGKGYKLTDEMSNIISDVIKRGYNIQQTDDKRELILLST